MKKYFIVATILLLAASCNSKPVSTEPVKNNNQQVEFGQEFKITKGQTVNFKKSSVTLEVLGFYNQPCPKDVQCFWSGQDIYYKITDGNKTYSHENLGDPTADGPFTLTVKDSDYTSYANLVLTKGSEEQSANLTTYTSPANYRFSIKYGSDFDFSTDISQVKALSYIPVCENNTVACAYLNKNNYKGTNFEGAGASVNIDLTLNTEAKCYNFKVETSEAQTPVEDLNINGINFKSATGGGAGAGHFNRVQVYRNFYNNKCYEISKNVAETNIQNYPEGTVKQFDENSVWNELQTVVNTFKFIDAEQTLLLPIKYNNAKYGFIFSLPQDWKGYSVMVYTSGTNAWEGHSLGGANGETTVTTGPKIVIRSPKWTAQHPWQDIPVYVFTLKQWADLQDDKFHIGAAPINPGELGHNKLYVFALPARYNYADAEGIEEVNEIMQSNPLVAY